MAIRCIWVLSPSRSDSVLFCKTYPCVEHCAKKRSADPAHPYVSIDHSTFPATLIHRYPHAQQVTKFVKQRDSCSVPDDRPFLSLDTEAGILSPLVVVERAGLLYCCLLLQTEAPPDGKIISPEYMATAAVCLAFLNSMAEFCAGMPPTVSTSSAKMAELSLFVSEACRYGTPRHTSCDNIKAALTSRPDPKAPKVKQPSWKPVLHKGKCSIHITVTERVKCVQYGHDSGAEDVWRVDGLVTCQCDLEGTQTRVSLSLSPSVPTAPQLAFVTYHSCVTSAAKKQSQDEAGYWIHCMPPMERVDLCAYEALVPGPPLHCKYSIKEETTPDSGPAAVATVHLDFTLKLSQETKNRFQYLQVHFPCSAGERIADYKDKVTVGSVAVNPKSHGTLTWNVGQKLPKSREATLHAVVTLAGGPSGGDNPANPGGANSLLLQGLTTYAKVVFKMVDFTQSAYRVSPQSVSADLPVKPKVTVATEYLSKDFLVWDSHREAPVNLTPDLSILESVLR